jgi:hypothetical protein
MYTRFLRLIITTALVALPFVVHAQGRRYPRPRTVHRPVSSPQPDLARRAISSSPTDLPRRAIRDPSPDPNYTSH